MKYQVESEILANCRIQGDYFQVDFVAPAIARESQPGQFVHVRIPLLEHRVLRRPFSIYNVEPDAGTVSVIYKVVGEGTACLSQAPAGATADLLGPLGRGFTVPSSSDALPVIVAGGYGCAATYLLARRSPRRPVCLFGARTTADLLLVREFRDLGCEVRIATNDGSTGHHGFVTALLEPLLKNAAATPVSVFACGPNPMLKAVAKDLHLHGLDGEISLDHAMCCGVGSCFACVVKRKADNKDGWEYARTCVDGPVFPASQTVWD